MPRNVVSSGSMRNPDTFCFFADFCLAYVKLDGKKSHVSLVPCPFVKVQMDMHERWVHDTHSKQSRMLFFWWILVCAACGNISE